MRNWIYILFGGGFAGVILHLLRIKNNRVNSVFPILLFSDLFSSCNLKIFWIFLKVGSILYDSGYVLFAFLDAELVKTGMLSEQELLDAIAVGQFTPGPVFSSATFIGWQIGGWQGQSLQLLEFFCLPFYL